MKTNTLIIAAISGFVATGAMAQTPTFADQTASADAVTAIEDSIIDAAERPVFGNEGRTPGTYGSVALTGSANTNDGAETSDVEVGLRWGTFDGVNGFDVTAAFSYSSDNATASGDTQDTKNQLQLDMNYRRDLTPAFFAYAKATASFDTLTVDAAEYQQDIFLGAGLGYRVFNTADTQWSLQAGPGYRAFTTGAGVDGDEVAGSVSSNFFKSLTDTTFVTNDTDVIYSETATTVGNTLALNVALTDTLTMRTSYTTNFNDASDDNFSDAENTLGVSVVYNFN